MAPAPQTDVRRTKDGRSWRIGSEADVAWIARGTTSDLQITSAIPPVFQAYATLELPGTGDHDPAASLEDHSRHDAAVLSVLTAHSGSQPWWLGYLNTGIGADTVFYDVPYVTLYAGWEYVLIEAGPEQAGSWRQHYRWKGALPDLMFPVDHAWLFSTLWDDDWTCIGGSRDLVNGFAGHPDLRHRVRDVDPSAPDATPPGHRAY